MNYFIKNCVKNSKYLRILPESSDHFNTNLKLINRFGFPNGDLSWRQYSSFRSSIFNSYNVFRSKLNEKHAALLSRRFYNTSDSYFVLDEYDCVGFDLDNTISEYNLNHSVKMEFDVLVEFLVKERGYDENYLLKPLIESDIDFIQRCLVVDTCKGNLLRLRGDGYIFKASHGTKLLSEKEIENIYGKDRKWYVTSDFSKNPIVTWNGPLSGKMRTFSDYFDMPAALALARCVDSVDDMNRNGNVDYFKIWKDVLKGLVNMYHRYNFSLNLGGYFPALKAKPNLYYKKCRPIVLDWLKELKKHKVVFLITGSNIDFAAHTASYCMGENWREYFDVVICYSRKPGFFLGGRPFVALDGFTETDSVSDDQIKIGGIYNQGNWQGLYQLFVKSTGKNKPKCLYIGDNQIQDVFTVSEYTCCDTVAVAEELAAEHLDHPAKNIIKSDLWGSFFSSDCNVPSLWGHFIENNSKICIPNLDVLASKPLDYKFSSFKSTNSGYHSLNSPLDVNKKVDKHLKIKL